MQVSGASAAWLLHWIILKAVLYALGIPSAVPFLEVVAYAGYPFVPTCLAMVAAIPSTIPGHSAGAALATYQSLDAAPYAVRCMCCRSAVISGAPASRAGLQQ